MIKIIAEFFIKPDSVEEAVSFAKELVAETQKEAGCIEYNLFTDDKDKSHLVIVEEWESQEVLDIHSSSEHFSRLVPAIGKLCEKEAVVHTYTKLA
jgi:Uncharacterized conserved protein